LQPYDPHEVHFMKTRTLILLAYIFTALFIIGSIAQLFISIAHADVPTSWNAAKNAASDEIYFDQTSTFYCGCEMTSHGDSDGSGNVDTATCDYDGPDTHSHRAGRLEWEHVVPASLMPARYFRCWVDEGRDHCQRTNPDAREMIFDLHNLVPSVGQVNALRSNDRYGEIEGEEREFGSCAIEDVGGLFEPADDQRGDVARVWLYMNWKHNVEIPEEELRMFVRWNARDPVSDWELERDKRIKAVQGNSNPWVAR
jgi:deoxyribonuclease I